MSNDPDVLYASDAEEVQNDGSQTKSKTTPLESLVRRQCVCGRKSCFNQFSAKQVEQARTAFRSLEPADKDLVYLRAGLIRLTSMNALVYLLVGALT